MTLIMPWDAGAHISDNRPTNQPFVIFVSILYNLLLRAQLPIDGTLEVQNSLVSRTASSCKNLGLDITDSLPVFVHSAIAKLAEALSRQFGQHRILWSAASKHRLLQA